MEKYLPMISICMSLLTVIGLIFTVWGKVKDPQVELDKRTALDKEEVDGKAVLLAKQMEWDRIANDKRFSEMIDNNKTALAMAQNHVHTVDTKVDHLTGSVNILTNEVVKLATIIDERLPKKNLSL